ncbi:uncharacterized protein [Palaemon carinicauda]|uniref:uncharacterized protein n=1 Tax=Palaemon carinicauda TaxID=392227 RepID=UPI0035B58930
MPSHYFGARTGTAEVGLIAGVFNEGLIGCNQRSVLSSREEKANVSDNRVGSDSEIEDKVTRHSKDDQKCNRKNEKKGKSNEKWEKKKGQDESEDDHELVKVVSKKKEKGNKKEDSSDDSTENEHDGCKTVFMREVTWCEKFNEHSSRDVYEFFKEYEKYCQDKYGDSK